MSKSEHAVEQFESGLNCSQAVAGEFADELGVDADAAHRLACGFGGGMGRTGSVCGAVTGAVMVIGLAACDPDPRASTAKLHTYELVRSFLNEFQQRHGSTICRELLGCDIGTPEGHAQAQQDGLFRTRCPRYVEDAVEILEDLLPRA
jgi:C_GCAxxG_C_C family probable redox protein